MLKRLHKIVGISVCLIVIHLSITGIILMYPMTFKLQDTYYTNSYISNLYDMYMVTDVRSFYGLEEDLGVIKSKIITSDMVIDTGINNIIGALKKDNLIFTLNDKNIVLIKESDYGLEVIRKAKIPFTAVSIGKDADKILLKEETGKFYIVDESLTFSLVKNNEIDFYEMSIVLPDEEIARYYLLQVQGPGIQALRLFADLHNGRFFGPFVMFIFAITSILVIFLSISGSYMTIKPSIKRYIYKARKKKRY